MQRLTTRECASLQQRYSLNKGLIVVDQFVKVITVGKIRGINPSRVLSSWLSIA
jgi:hypothetical protein